MLSWLKRWDGVGILAISTALFGWGILGWSGYPLPGMGVAAGAAALGVAAFATTIRNTTAKHFLTALGALGSMLWIFGLIVLVLCGDGWRFGIGVVGVLTWTLVMSSFVIYVGKAWRSLRPVRDRVDALIVLGAGLAGRWPAPVLEARCRRAAELVETAATPPGVVVVSGGQGPDEVVPESDAMFRFLLREYPELGAGAGESGRTKVTQEPRATNTRQNLVYSWALLRPHAESLSVDGALAPRRIAVVTSAFHVPRTRGLVRQLCGAGELPGPDERIEIVVIGAPSGSGNPLAAYIREFVAYGAWLTGRGAGAKPR